jgi:hypothetical protein
MKGLEVVMRLDFNYGMAGRGHNGVNPMWFGRCWGYWLPRTQWNVGRDSAEAEREFRKRGCLV